MKKAINYLTVLGLLITMAGCSTRSYTVAKVKTSHQKSLPAPPGMVYIPAGSVMLGQSDIDSTYQDSSGFKKVSLSGFYIDKTEISNKQYRQFVYWVRDSIAVTDYIREKQFFIHNKNGDTSIANIDWKKIANGRQIWASHNHKIQEKLRAMYLQGKNQIDVSILNFEFETINPGTGTGLTEKETLNIYPDTTVWIKDFPNSQNYVMTKSYFSNPVFDDYPVVGVTWKQARAFAAWRTKIWSAYSHTMLNPKLLQLPIDLPTEAQWAYAAEGKHLKADTTKSKKDKKTTKVIAPAFKANYKQGEGDYAEDGAAYTVPVASYAPNSFGLYNMAGNVSEWTLNYYTESATAFVHDLNPVLYLDAKSTDPLSMQRKVVCGGSWKDVGFFVAPSTRSAEYQGSPKSYIGFRCVMQAPDILVSETSKTRN